MPWLLRVAVRINQITQLDYTLAERIRLLSSSYRTSGQEADVLGFRVSYLDRESFRVLLSEIFLKAEYSFSAETDCPRILDCGANIGLATLFFKYLYPQARISAFEADPDTAAILMKNVDQNRLQGVSVHNVMLANEEGENSFFVASDTPGSLMMSGIPNRLTKSREIRVKTGRLSSYIDGFVDLLKLDVEGAEFDVMADLERSGKLSLVKKMIIEYHHKIGNQPSNLAQFLTVLERAGFEYQLSGNCDPVSRQHVFQDILIGAYRSS